MTSILQVPRVAHLVVSLAHGGLERLVVDWTNARNRRFPGSTGIICLDQPGDLAFQVDGECVTALRADRSRSPWDREAVARLRGWMRGGAGAADRDEEATPNIQHPTSNVQRPASSVRHSASTVHCSLFTDRFLPPAILHAHNLAAWQYAVLAAWGTGVRTVYTQHGANAHNQGLKDRLRARFLALLTDELVAVSASTARSMSRSLWIPKSGIRVVANGVEGGRVQDEGLSMGLLEAMAAGVPVAVTDVGANREVIEDGACGILLPEDETLWPGVLRVALDDPGRRESLAERARCRVDEHYSMQATLNGYERVYGRLAVTRRRGGCGDDCACGRK